MSQRQQLERVMEIDRQIRAGLFPNADRLAEELEVSRRVIFNDRQFMLDRLRAPLAFDRRRGGWHYSEPTWVLPAIMMTQGDLLAFFLSVEIARRHVGTELEAALNAAVDKISSTLPESVPVHLEMLRAHYTFAAPSMLAADLDTLLALDGAIANCQAVWIRYYTASRAKHSERVIHPHHLVNTEGDWHLIAYDQMRRRLTTFHVGRIEAWRLLDRHFTREPGFNATEWMNSVFQSERADAVVQVAIRFDVYQARWMRERHWHATQEIEELPDGGLVLRFQCGGLQEVMRFVLRYGSHAEVLAPATLRKAVQAEARKMVEQYGAG